LPVGDVVFDDDSGVVGLVFGGVVGKPAHVAGARIPRERMSRATLGAVAMSPSASESVGEFCGEKTLWSSSLHPVWES
jgi:hypothetical protein